MTQDERMLFLIRALLAEDPRYEHAGIEIPHAREARWRLLRSLMNVRPPRPVDAEVLRVQDAFLAEDLAHRGTVGLGDLQPADPARPDVYLWRGDITRLATDGVVNAANSRMLGCFAPCHGCIDNATHEILTWMLPTTVNMIADQQV